MILCIHKVIATDFDLYITLLFWKYSEEAKSGNKSVKKGWTFLMPLEQFASCISGLNNNRSYLTDEITKYLKSRNPLYSFVI